MGAASLTGLMCRVLLLTSVAYEDTGQITLELSTPRFVAPTSMLFCFTSTNFQLTSDTVDVSSISEGGSIFAANETVVGTSPLQTSRFSLSSTGDQLNAIEIGTVYNVLGTDPFYASTYRLQRYDDLIRDQQGTLIRGLVDFPEDTSADAGYRAQQGNCFLLTGAWKADTRYQVTLRVTNPSAPPLVAVPTPPPPPAASPPSPAPSPQRANTSSISPGAAPSPPVPPTAAPSASPPASAPPNAAYILVSNNATPSLWVAPVTHTVSTWGAGSDAVQSLLFSVRGNKYGAACTLRPAIVPFMGTMFDACVESRRRGLGPPVNVNTSASDCLRRLRVVASLPANQGALPFTAPPLRAYTLTSFRDTACPAANTVLGPRMGGECIRCGQYGVKGAGTCTCPAGVLPNKVGSVACGDPIAPDGSVGSLAELPPWLCRRFSAAKKDWQEKDLLAHNVAKQYVDAFTQLASPLLDHVTVAAAHETFMATLVFDDRRPDSPTRRLGIKPNCNKCTDGKFKDVWTKEMTPVFDWHFDAMNTFRFLGYLLDQALGSPCPELWDSSRPRQWEYGYYDQIICKPLPEGTCCGANFQGDPAVAAA